MGRRAAREAGAGEEPSLTPTPHLSWGTIIVMDLDRFEDVTRERGYDEYKPNDVTGKLSHLVEWLARKWGGVVVYGLDWERGTEEALIEVPYTEPSELAGDLERIAREVEEEGVTITIVAVSGHVAPMPGDRRAYKATPARRRALRVLERLKAAGGGVVYVDGSIVYRSRAARQGRAR